MDVDFQSVVVKPRRKLIRIHQWSSVAKTRNRQTPNSFSGAQSFQSEMIMTPDKHQRTNIDAKRYIGRSTAVQNLLFSVLIIYMEKLVDSDWLRAVQFKCNTSAKSVTPVQIT